MCNKYIQTACAVSQRGAEVYSRIIPDLPAINSLGSLNLKYVQQSLIMSVLEVRNNFIKTRVTVKSSDLMSALFNGQTSNEYNNIGMHLLFTKCKKTSFHP